MTTAQRDEGEILLSNVRLSYFYGFKPYTGDDGKGSYTAHSIFGTTHPQVAAIQALIRKVAVEQWKDKADAVLQQLKAQDKLCIHRGDISKPGKDGYAGMLFISANNKTRPRILATIDGVNQDVDESSEYAPYSGCWANVRIRIWAQDNPKWGKRINAELRGVQFKRHDQRLGGGGGAAALDEFGVDAPDADSAAPATGDEGLVY